MVIDKYRPQGNKYLIPIAKKFKHINPNTLTIVSLLFAFLAGLAFYLAETWTIKDFLDPTKKMHYMLILASLFVFFNAGFDAIDGEVARLSKRASPRGDFIDHAVDRYADLFILGGIMLSGYCDMLIGALAIFAVMLTSYMGTQAQALGVGRDYSGVLGRADRLVLLLFAPLIQYVILFQYTDGSVPWLMNFTFLEIIMIWFFIAGNVTALHRARRIWVDLKRKEKIGR
jgi:archaetidylinositol phosphate synthase